MRLVRDESPPGGADAPEAQEVNLSRFPVIALFAPGSVCLLFTAGTIPIINALNSVWQGLVISTIALLGVFGCFGVIGAKTKAQPAKIACAIAIGAGIFAYCTSLLQVI